MPNKYITYLIKFHVYTYVHVYTIFKKKEKCMRLRYKEFSVILQQKRLLIKWKETIIYRAPRSLL